MLLVSGWSSALCSFTRMQLIISGVWMSHFTLKVYIYLIKSARFLGGGGCYLLTSAPVLCSIVNLTEGIWGNLSLSVKRHLKFMSNFLSQKNKHLEGSSAAQSQLTTKHPRSTSLKLILFHFIITVCKINHDNYQDRHSWVRWGWNAMEKLETKCSAF